MDKEENTLDLLLNVSRLATEMDDPTLFAGRQEELRALAEALHVRGSAPVIPGIGGSGSLASPSSCSASRWAT
jgi:hypothetical protein